MKKGLIINLAISMILGVIINATTFFVVKGNCINTTIDMPNAVSKYESKNCKDTFGLNDRIYGYPLPYIKIGPRCSGFICPMDMYSQQKVTEIIWQNLFIDSSIWSLLTFSGISIITFLRKNKNAK